MKVEGLLALFRTVLSKTRAATLDLDTATCLLLDVLDVLTPVSNDRCSKVEAGDGLEVNKHLLFGPFALI